MSVIQEEIQRIRDSVDALEAMLPKDKPQPRSWRMWDIVRDNTTVLYIRKDESLRPWQPILQNQQRGCNVSDKWMRKNVKSHLGNLADLLAQGDVLLGRTEEEATEISATWDRCGTPETIQESIGRSCTLALAARKEKPCS